MRFRLLIVTASLLAVACGSAFAQGTSPGKPSAPSKFAGKTLEQWIKDTKHADPGVRDEMSAQGPHQVVRALAEALAGVARLDRERFRRVANEVRARTGQKGKQLFHPIRVALTGLAEGPELDLVIPAIDRGADLPREVGVPAILGCRERAGAFVAVLDR